MKYIGANMKELEFLEKVELNLHGCDEITPWDLKDLSDNLQEFKALENITLHLPENSVIDGGISNLSHGLHNLGSLKEITLNLNGSLKISDIEFQSIGELLEGLSAIERISLDISVTDRKEEEIVISLISIGAALRRLESLQEIRIILSGFFRVRIEDEGLFYFAESLKKVESLKKIELDLKECWLNEMEARRIEEDLEKSMPEKDVDFIWEHSKPPRFLSEILFLLEKRNKTLVFVY